MMKRQRPVLSLSLLAILLSFSPVFAAEVSVHFDQPLQDWDGFGVNYVEASQTRDYDKWPQDYGGFSTLRETKRREIIRGIFGEDGLKPGIVKMFLDGVKQVRNVMLKYALGSSEDEQV